MSERFDDTIKQQLQGLESPVPQAMFDKIRNHPDVSNAMFDAGISNALHPLESPVPEGQFDKMSAANDLANTSFDEAIRQQFTTLETAVPANMWERITERKRRRRPVAWWWVAAGLFLLMSGATWYGIQQVKEKTGSENGIIASKKPATEKENALTDKGNSSSNNIPVPYPALQTAPDSSNIHNSTQDVYTNSPLAKPSDYLNAYNKNKEKKIAQKVSDAESNNTRYTGKHFSAKRNGANGLAIGKEEPVILNSGVNNNELPTDDIESALNTLQLTITEQLRIAARLIPGQLLKTTRLRSPVIPCPVNAGEGRNDWYTDVYASAFMVNKTIADKQAGKNAKSGFDSTLHRQVSYNAGISLVKNIGENILLKTGLQYNRLNESFRLTRINERKLVTTVSVRIVILSPGDTVYIRDTSVTETIGIIQRRTQNTYKQWDVPLIIGYEFGGENIRLNANAGIIANIRSAYSGEMISDTLQQVIDASNYNGKPVYKTNVGISLYAGLSILKPLGERTSLLIEPYARIGLGNTTTSNAWFRQKNSAAGISVGLRYKLNSGGQRR